jgi:molybdopterin-synthase adenylyltransferase
MSWLDRQSFLGAQSDEVLNNCKVAVIGLGGGGSHIVQQLAHVGVGRFVVVDPQSIDLTNLNRLVGATRADVRWKRRKVDIAARVIRLLRPKASIRKIADYWQTAGEVLKTCDVIFGCVDSVRAKDELEAFCRRFMIPYIDIGMDVHKQSDGYLIAGQVVFSSPGTPCLRCFGIVTEAALAREGKKYGDAGGLPQVVWPNGILASTAVGLFIQLVLPWYPSATNSAYLEYDGNAHTVVPSNRFGTAFARECKHHPAGERGDPGFDIRSAGTRSATVSGFRWLLQIAQHFVGNIKK